MTIESDLTPESESLLAGAVEDLARDLLALFRSVRVYPAEHPFLQDLARRISNLLGERLPAPLSLGITPEEITVGSCFVGSKHRRARELAGFLHGKKVLQVKWLGAPEPSAIVAFAEVLADARWSGEDLRAALERRRVHGVDVEPLVLSRIHDSFREGSRRVPDGETDRKAWVWLLRKNLPSEEAAKILASDSFWASVERDGGVASEEAKDLAGLLAEMGERLGAALDCLPEERRDQVEGRLARVGRALAPRDLARILKTAGTLGVLQGPLGEVLEETFGTEKLVDLLANLVAVEGRGTRRLAEVYGRFGSEASPSALLAAVRSRLAGDDRGGFAGEVWGAVEEFLLSLEEDPFMGADYSSTLEELATERDSESSPPLELDLTEDAEESLDGVVAGLALDDAKAWGGYWLERLGSRLEGERMGRLLPLLEDVDKQAKGLLEPRADLVEKAFRLGMSMLRELDSTGRQALLAFTLAHETVLLDPVLRALATEDTMTVRRFLVDVIARFSSASTPALVSRMRSAPWYVTRNLAIALGRRRETVAMPALRSLLGHDHYKVRREAILALGQFDTAEARQTLADLARAKTVSGEERVLAARALRQQDSSEMSV